MLISCKENEFDNCLVYLGFLLVQNSSYSMFFVLVAMLAILLKYV